jgi:RNA polymerase sigma-54 factor
LNLSLDMSLKLQQRLSFQMIQSLKLLQVNTLQLEQLLKTELELNPVLEASDELEEVQDEQQSDEVEIDQTKESEPELELSEEKVDWEEYLEEGFDLGYSHSEETDHGAERYESTPVYKANLDEHLTNQISEKNLPENRYLAVLLLIGYLDNEGYLRTPLEEIAQFAKVEVFELDEALNILQSLDPAGVGARTLQECMMIQLHRLHKHESLAGRIVIEAWDLLEKLKIPDIARKFAVDPREIQDAINLIRKLHPKPGLLVGADNSSTIIPDLIVEKIDGKLVVMLNDRSVPSLHINKAYANMIRRGSKARTEEKQYVREKLNSASWLIRSIEQRKTTMLNVMYAIIERQPEFFEKGPPNLSPLKLQDVADMISMHISTVSRVTSNKYVQTPFGIFELKYFFTEAMGQDIAGGDVSSEKIKSRLRELVAAENPSKPLSDQKLADILSREHLALARRTVAKYREQLKILPARMRQKYE